MGCDVTVCRKKRIEDRYLGKAIGSRNGKIQLERDGQNAS